MDPHFTNGNFVMYESMNVATREGGEGDFFHFAYWDKLQRGQEFV